MLLSVLFEAPVAALLVHRVRPGQALAAAGASALATAASHPQLWAAALWAYPRYGYGPSLIGLEILVVLFEAGVMGWILRLRPAQALGLSFAANLASVAAGLLLA
ncbi:hypothetical protein DKG75_14000 [Zavarzinia compransoris]|uniref:Uncharacterized protein n=2 Tax=Zavarzinia compransoris TaxID=1264899 RepID=A0A317DYV2_9PROT|nr:hypothetical protein DKG75_14000 [Zavarzinia compransoris]